MFLFSFSDYLGYQTLLGEIVSFKMDVHSLKLYHLTIFISVWLCCDGHSTEKWDYLVFSQAWPITLCIKNEHNRLDTNEKCLFPQNALEWTIHGIWPTSFNGNSPSYCNKSASFDDSKIEDIRIRLQEFWPNMLRDRTVESLWKHEWDKHGTCALDFEPLNNERKYFGKGLDLYGTYNMTSLLPSLAIFPEKSKEYSVLHIFNLIQKVLSKAPYIECIEKKGAGSPYLAEIRLCFDKGLKLIDCIPHHHQQGDIYSLTNCPEGSTIIYPKNVQSDHSNN